MKFIKRIIKKILYKGIIMGDKTVILRRPNITNKTNLNYR